MERYKFDNLHSKKIVDAIVEGYQDYIDHRKDRYEKMNISSAFAWTKGNFIESKIAEISEDLNLTFKRARAGLSWDYLQFIQGDKKVLFLIKNAAYFNANSFSHATISSSGGNGHLRTYLHILTYKIDRAFQISEIMHYLPNPADNIAYEVEDLSVHISGAELTDEDREVIAPELANDLIDSAAFDIGIREEEESN